jgi:L-cystine uptake protein TcyP (sodium:dicarboxylate symporter family)
MGRAKARKGNLLFTLDLIYVNLGEEDTTPRGLETDVTSELLIVEFGREGGTVCHLYSLANNVVPAVVVFSMAVGLALIGIGQKDSLLAPLTLLNRAMALVTGFISKLMPLGVFAIVVSAAGTMDLEELGRLQVYLLTYAAIALLLTLWVLPALIMSLTPLTYRQVVGQTRGVSVRN